MSGLVFIISAPSGSGKSTLVNGLRSNVPGLEFSVSYTTRKPRGVEKQGYEYFYVDRAAFERMIEQHEFLEYADVFGNYYGTARRFLVEAHAHGNDLLLDIDVQGASQLQASLPDAISIFILPPNRAELERRLRCRSEAEHVDGEIINRRLRTAAKEIENYSKYSYILVNDHLQESIDALTAIVLSERRKRSRGELCESERALLAKAEQYLLPNVRERVQPILASFALPESQVVRK
ncbi:MAG TPA: guanylate kinase [Clostridia bacterium]|nr:guanylate kinase [Clostridia bacterium]